MSHYFYARLNPWYLSKVIPKLFPAFTRNFTLLKKTLTSIAVDLFTLQPPITAFFLTMTALWGTKGHIKNSYEIAKR